MLVYPAKAGHHGVKLVVSAFRRIDKCQGSAGAPGNAIGSNCGGGSNLRANP